MRKIRENKTPAETFPKFPSVLRVIDRSDRNPPITATSVTFWPSLRHASGLLDFDLICRYHVRLTEIWKHFRGCFVFQSRASTKTVVNYKIQINFSLPLLHTLSFSESGIHKNNISSKQKTRQNKTWFQSMNYLTKHISLSWILELTKDSIQLLFCGRRDGLMVSALVSGSSGPGSSPGRGIALRWTGIPTWI